GRTIFSKEKRTAARSRADSHTGGHPSCANSRWSGRKTPRALHEQHTDNDQQDPAKNLDAATVAAQPAKGATGVLEPQSKRNERQTQPGRVANEQERTPRNRVGRTRGRQDRRQNRSDARNPTERE